ncbi:MAG: 6-hydroxymethylpterin diphosphokinase MptE-like protein [Desulfobacter sp.]
MAKWESNYFENNLFLLKKNHGHLVEVVSESRILSDKTTIVYAENGKPNIRVETREKDAILIHDPDDPGIESETFLSMVPQDSTGVVLMFGMGLGYSVIELLEKRKTIQFLIIFEAEPDLFIHAMHAMDLSTVLTDKRVVLCIGEPADLPTVIGPANRALMLEDIHTLNLLSCFKIDPAYETISSRVFDLINAFNTEGATKILYGRTFVENRLKHMTSMHHDRKLEDLKAQFENVPALIIAAGPSLDKNIDQVHKAVGKAIIICVDTALPNLLNHDIIPDFVTSIDYKELTYEKIAPVAAHPASRRVNLICTTWVTDMVPKVFPFQSVFWAFNNNALENWMNISLGGRLAVSGAGTVAHLNFVAAKIMGCDPVIFAGQDLAYSEKRSHASHVSLRSDEQIKKMLESGEEVIWVKGVLESKVPTNRQMYGYKNTFETMIKNSGGLVINATEGGAFIEGTEAMPLSTAIENFCNAPIKLDIQFMGKPVDLLQPVEETYRKLLKIEKLAQKVKKTAKPVQEKLKKLQNVTSFAGLPRDVQEKVSTFDKYQIKIDKDPIWEMFDELTLENMRQDERQKMKIDSLANTPEKYLEWLSKSVDRVDKINTIRMENLGWFKDRINELISYYKTEKIKTAQIEKNEKNIKNILDLAELYEQSKNYALLKKLLDAYALQAEKGEKNAMIQYFYGVIALYHGDYEAAEKNFDIAVNLDGLISERIAEKQREIGDYYFKLAMPNKIPLTGIRPYFTEKLLLNGLKSCPDHTGIRNIFRQFSQEDLEKSRQDLEPVKNIVEKWIARFDAESRLFDYLDKGVIQTFYGLYGKNLIAEKNFEGALAAFKKAWSIDPCDPDICIVLADLSFTMADFDSGLGYLKEAVDLDKEYAVYWYNIGKNLFDQNDFNGAVIAYENYFKALPENYGVLKEIGDCYQALGQLEAAREAYLQFKNAEINKVK